MENKHSISVVSTVYNTPVKYLQKYFQSIYNQTYSNFEWVIVDDGSVSDETIDYLKEIESKDSRIKLYIENVNRGVGAATNLAISKSKGDYIFIVDSDDWIEATVLEKLYNKIVEDNSDVAIANYSLCSEDGKEYYRSNIKDEASELYFISTTIASRLIKRSVLMDNNIYYPEGKYVEDLVRNSLIYAFSEKISVVDTLGYNIRIHSLSTSHNRDRYSRLTVDLLPLDYLQEQLEKIRFYVMEPEKKNALCAYLIHVLASMTCLWTRNSTYKQRREVALVTAEIARSMDGYCKEIFKAFIIWNGKRYLAFFSCIWAILVKIRLNFLLSEIMGFGIRLLYKEK